jgi:hypothetical protein
MRVVCDSLLLDNVSPPAHDMRPKMFQGEQREMLTGQNTSETVEMRTAMLMQVACAPGETCLLA